MDTQYLKLAFVNIFTEEVAKRLDKEKWNMPNRWDDQVDSTVSCCVNRGIDNMDRIITFVKAQFDVFDPGLSKKLFRMKYPPIGVFRSEPSFKRYYRYVNMMMKDASIRKKTVDVPVIVMSEYRRANCSKSGRLNLDKLQLCIQNGSVSSNTVAFLIIKFQLSDDVSRELANLVRVCQEKNLFKSYKLITNLINKGELNAK